MDQEQYRPRSLTLPLLPPCILQYTAPNGHVYTRQNVNNEVSQFDLYDSYYPHFQAAVTPVAQGGGGAAGVMMAMNEVNGASYAAGL